VLFCVGVVAVYVVADGVADIVDVDVVGMTGVGIGCVVVW